MEVKRAHVEPPPGKATRPVADVPTVNGRRVVLYSWDNLTGPSYTADMRAVSEVFTQDGDTTLYVHAVTEAAWYAWQADTSPAKPERCPRARCYPAYLVFAEV